MIELNRATLGIASEFAFGLLHSRTFTHFRHTLPLSMLDPDKWKVWMQVEEGLCVSWGQAQLFSDHKAHVARLGFAVRDGYRDAGLGSAMLDHVLSKMGHKEKLTASVFADNASMLHMFLARGFVEEGRFLDEERWDEQRRAVVSVARYG